MSTVRVCVSAFSAVVLFAFLGTEYRVESKRNLMEPTSSTVVPLFTPHWCL